MLLAKVVVPADNLRNRPVLSKRGKLPASVKSAVVWTSKSAPLRFVTTPADITIPPAPVQVVEPAFSSVRPSVIEAALLIARLAVGLINVRPEPLMVPPDQVI